MGSFVVFVVALAGEAEVELSHVNAALSKDDQCALGAAGCALEALQTKAVKGLVDGEDDASAEIKVIGDVESRVEDDDHVPEIRELEDIAKWYEEDNATAAESRVADVIALMQEEF